MNRIIESLQKTANIRAIARTTRRLATAALFAGLLNSFPAISAPTGDTDTPTLLELVRQAQANGDVGSAIVRLKSALQIDQGDAAARLELARIYVDIRDGAQAEQELKTGRNHGLNEEDILDLLAQAYLLQGKNESVLAEINPVPGDSLFASKLLVRRGQAYLRLEDHESAWASLTDAAERAPLSPLPHREMAIFHFTTGDHESADAAIDQALLLVPNDPENLIVKSKMLGAKKDYQGALEYLDRAIVADPPNSFARLYRASILGNEGKYEQADVDLEWILEYSPAHPGANFMRAIFLLRQDKHERAIDVLRRVMKPLEQVADAHLLMATLALSTDQLGQAEAAINYFRSLNPDHPEGRRMAAYLFLQRNVPEEAIRAIRPLTEQNPSDLSAVELLASAYFLSNDFASAADWFGRARNLDPTNLQTRHKLASSHIQAGNTNAAVKELEGIIAIDPEDSKATTLLLTTKLLRKDYTGAVEAAHHLAKISPNSPQPDHYLGIIKHKENNIVAAREYFQSSLEKQPDYVPSMLKLAELEAVEGRDAEAKIILRRIVAKQRNNIKALVALSVYAEKEGQKSESILLLERAIAATPRVLAPRLRLINALRSIRRHDKAFQVAHDLSQLAPDNAGALEALASTQVDTGRITNAISTYRLLLAQRPKSAKVHMALANAQIVGGYESAASEPLLKAVQLDPGLTSAMVSLARIKMGENQLHTAKLWYQRALGVDAHQVDAAVGLANILILESNLDEARSLLEQTITTHPSAIAVRQLLVKTLLHQGHRDQALLEAGHVLSAAPNNPSALQTMGEAQLVAGQIADATATFAKLVAITPNSASAQYEFGRTLFAAENYPEASRALEKAISLSSDMLPAKLLLSETYFREKNTVAALEIAVRATEDHPSNPIAMAALGDLYSKLERYDEAVAMHEAAFHLSPDRRAFQGLYNTLKQSERLDQARRAFEKYLALYPLDYDMRYSFAGELIKFGVREDAVRHYKLIPESHPSYAIALNNLAILYAVKSPETALDYAEKAATLRPESPSIGDTLGWLLVRRGDLERGTQLLATAWAAANNSPAVGYHYAEALARSGHAKKAVEILRKTLTAGPFEEQEAAEELLHRLENLPG